MITALESCFQADKGGDLGDLSQSDITDLHKQYAGDLLHDKRFIFGKYAVSKLGNVCTNLSF